MTDIRTAILSKLGASSGFEWQQPEPVLPAFVVQSIAPVELLKQKLEAVHASIDFITSTAQIDASIANFLRRHQSPMQVGITPAIDLHSLSPEQGVEYHICEDFSACHTILTHAVYGIAETGSLVLPSSLQRPTLANFLPDNCIVLLDEGDIVPYMEDALLKIQVANAGMPRALNLISGPSKTADIEQTLVYGAHGPIQLHVIIRRLK